MCLSSDLRRIGVESDYKVKYDVVTKTIFYRHDLHSSAKIEDRTSLVHAELELNHYIFYVSRDVHSLADPLVHLDHRFGKEQAAWLQNVVLCSESHLCYVRIIHHIVVILRPCDWSSQGSSGCT